MSVKIKGDEIKTKQAKNKFIKKRTQININSCSKNKKNDFKNRTKRNKNHLANILVDVVLQKQKFKNKIKVTNNCNVRQFYRINGRNPSDELRK